MIKNVSVITASSYISMLFLGVAGTLVGAASRNIGLLTFIGFLHGNVLIFKFCVIFSANSIPPSSTALKSAAYYDFLQNTTLFD